MLVTLASGFGVLIPVGARVGQKLPVSIHTATSGWGVGAERLGCVLIPRLTVIEPWSLSRGANRPSSVPLATVPLGLGFCTRFSVGIKPLLYHSLDG